MRYGYRPVKFIHMKMQRRLSLAEWFKQVGGACRRFPIAVLLLVFFTGYLMSLINSNGHPVDEKWNFFYIFYPATGALLAVSLQLLTEDFKHRALAIVTQVLAHSMWLGVSLYLTQFERFSMQQMVGVGATVVAMTLSLFVLCFYRKDDDVPFWNFAQRLLIALISGTVVGGILTLGIILFVQSLDWLFGVAVDGWFLYIPTFCMCFLAPMLAMSQIPEGKQKHIHEVAPYTGFAKGVVQYLFIPLLLLYMATLYVYAAKILLTWQLPVGWVCYLVSASMLGMVVLIFITYPLQHEPGNSIFKTLTRLLPLAMLPLLVLMSVAIGRRLSDYGITVSRLYVLVFNVWCYVVCIGLLLCRNRRIWWVPTSFAAVLLLISVGPWSIPNVTENCLLAEVRMAFEASGAEGLPLTGEQYEKWLKSADEKVAKSIDAKLYYLQMAYDFDSTLGLVAKDAVVGNGVEHGVSVVMDNEMLNYYNSAEYLMAGADIPKGYSHMTMVDDVKLVKQEGNRLVLEVALKDSAAGESTYRFEAMLNQLAVRDVKRNHHSRVEPLVLNNGNAALMLSHFNVTIEAEAINYSSFMGILFTR